MADESRPRSAPDIFDAHQKLIEHTREAIQILEGGNHHTVEVSASAAVTRECEGCGQRKPVEEMETVFAPGTGESYQCEECRGGP